MDAAVEQLQTLLELEARHEELLDRLAELDKRVAGVLAQCQASASADQTLLPGGEGHVDWVPGTQTGERLCSPGAKGMSQPVADTPAPPPRQGAHGASRKPFQGSLIRGPGPV